MKLGPISSATLLVLRDLMLGGRHSRQTVARMGVSPNTADRWLKSLLVIPGVRRVREGKTSWFEWVPPKVKGKVLRSVTVLS